MSEIGKDLGFGPGRNANGELYAANQRATTEPRERSLVDAVRQIEVDHPFRGVRMGMAKTAIEHLAKVEYGSAYHDIAGIAAWAMIGGDREQLLQLLKGPVWDGDVISKNSRDRLLQLGLAVRCCVNCQQGYTAASYTAYTIWSIATGVQAP